MSSVMVFGKALTDLEGAKHMDDHKDAGSDHSPYWVLQLQIQPNVNQGNMHWLQIRETQCVGQVP